MIMAAWVAQALSWIRVNWQGLLVGVALASLLAALKGCVASNPAPVAVATAGAAQSLSGTATASSGAVIEIPGRPEMPCPESKKCPECPAVRIVYDCKAAVAGGAASSVSAKASVEPSKAVFGLWAGAGAVDVLGAQVGVYGQIQAQYGRFAIPLRYDSSQKVSLGLDYKMW